MFIPVKHLKTRFYGGERGRELVLEFFYVASIQYDLRNIRARIIFDLTGTHVLTAYWKSSQPGPEGKAETAAQL